MNMLQYYWIVDYLRRSNGELSNFGDITLLFILKTKYAIII